MNTDEHRFAPVFWRMSASCRLVVLPMRIFLSVFIRVHLWLILPAVAFVQEAICRFAAGSVRRLSKTVVGQP
jgi:hypothetical protein